MAHSVSQNFDLSVLIVDGGIIGVSAPGAFLVAARIMTAKLMKRVHIFLAIISCYMQAGSFLWCLTHNKFSSLTYHKKEHLHTTLGRQRHGIYYNVHRNI